jgi:hypothetical protein
MYKGMIMQDCQEANQKILVKAIVGSHAYGFNKPDSDQDYLGVFIVPTKTFMGLYGYPETIVRNSPDRTYHEVGKFMRLAMKGNPTVLELLYFDDYLITSPEFEQLIFFRAHFLSKQVRGAYLGYAIAQINKLKERVTDFESGLKKRTTKHARHCFRLLWQYRELCQVGCLTPRLSIPECEELLAFDTMTADEIVEKFESEFQAFEDLECPFKATPDLKKLNEILVSIREDN